MVFCSPSRGRTRQLKADTVALAKTWHGAPHTAAEIFPGENPAPNTCKRLPPRQPAETKSQARYLGGKSCTQSLSFTFSLCNFLNPHRRCITDPSISRFSAWLSPAVCCSIGSFKKKKCSHFLYITSGDLQLLIFYMKIYFYTKRA